MSIRLTCASSPAPPACTRCVCMGVCVCVLQGPYRNSPVPMCAQCTCMPAIRLNVLFSCLYQLMGALDARGQISKLVHK